ncbi:MAG: Gfo/Idh/MocA family oxidoreductase, partial [Thermoleophilia bacterium]|nr:Gfo/Idh/MocA family oxidoreductase [Thermoleophilia bacterium]
APALLGASNARLRRILTRDPARARAGLREACGWHLARRIGGSKLALKLRYSRLPQRVDALGKLGTAGAFRVAVDDDLGRFLADPTVEAVWVASPPFLHREHVEAALAAGKHVLCEKPIATTAADARAMADAARRAGRVLAVGYQMRQHSYHQRLREQARAGEYGPIREFRATMHFKLAAPRDWHRRNDQSGGWAVCEAGTHLVDLALWFLGGDTPGGGAVTAVSGDLSRAADGFETDDRATIHLTFAGGATALLDVSAVAETPAFSFEVAGDSGGFACDNTLFGAPGTATVTGAATEAVPEADLAAAQVEAFSRRIRGDASAPLATADEGVSNLEIIERARGW